MPYRQPCGAPIPDYCRDTHQVRLSTVTLVEFLKLAKKQAKKYRAQLPAMPSSFKKELAVALESAYEELVLKAEEMSETERRAAIKLAALRSN